MRNRLHWWIAGTLLVAGVVCLLAQLAMVGNVLVVAGGAAAAIGVATAGRRRPIALVRLDHERRDR